MTDIAKDQNIDPWSAASAAAIEESDNTEVNEEPAINEADLDTEDHSEVETAESEQVHEDDEEVHDSEDESEDSEVEQEPTSVEWDGRPDTLPEPVTIEGVEYDLRGTYKKMHGNYTRVMQNAHNKIRESENELQQKHAKVDEMLSRLEGRVAEVEDPMPERPTSDMSPEEQDRRWNEIMAWQARKAVGEAMGPKEKAGVQPTQPSEEELAKTADERLNTLVNHPEWDDSLGEVMNEIARQDPTWGNYARSSNDGIIALMRFAKQQKEIADLKAKAAENENKSIRRRGGAGRNAVSRSTSAPTVSKKSDKFTSFEEASQAALREHGG